MFRRTDLRVEDVLAGGFALSLAAFAGARATLGSFRLNEENFWDISFIVAPVAFLVFFASVRYALGTGLLEGAGPLREIGGVLRDWSPFLLFSLAYETFRTKIWTVLLVRDRDADLLRLDRLLFGETPAVPLERFLSPLLTNVMAVSYFMHLVLPPTVAVLLYRRQRQVFREFLLAILVAGVLGSIGYVAVPAVGPGVAFPDLFRTKLSGELYQPMAEILDAARAPRDAFPSLHVAISTIVLWYGAKRGRAFFGVLLLLVLGNWASTLYLRYHYLVDVLAGWATAGAAIFAAHGLLSLEVRLKRAPGTSSA